MFGEQDDDDAPVAVPPDSGEDVEHRVFKGHNSDVKGVCWNPNGQQIATASKDNTVRVFDVETGNALRLDGHTRYVSGVSWHPQGRLIASASADNTCRLWTPEGDAVQEIKVHDKALNTCCFSPDEKYLATGADDNAVCLIDVETCTLARRIEASRGIIWNVNFTNDGTLMAWGAWDSTVAVWDVRSNSLVHRIDHGRDNNGVCFDPYSSMLAFGSDDHVVHLYDMATWRPFRQFLGHTLRVMSVQFSPEGTVLASGAADNSVRLWHLDTGRPEILAGHYDSVTGVAFHECRLASSSFDRTAMVWYPDLDEGLPTKAATTASAMHEDNSHSNGDSEGADGSVAEPAAAAVQSPWANSASAVPNDSVIEWADVESPSPSPRALFPLPWRHETSGTALVAVGANPAVQKTLKLPSFSPGTVNRCDSSCQGFGGKGQLFARAANGLCPGSCTVVQFVGGSSGEFLCQNLDSVGIPHRDILVPGATRTCTTIISTGPAAEHRETEVIEPSAPVDEAMTAALIAETRRCVLQQFEERRRVGLAIQGTCPPGCGDAFYASLCRDVRDAVVQHTGSAGPLTILLDGYRNVLPALESGLIDILKVNVHELRKLAEQLALDPAQGVQDIGHAVLGKCPLQVVAVTDGAGPAWLCSRDAGGFPLTFRFTLPAVVVDNAIGCGDTTGAGFLSALLSGASPRASFRFGLAVGCAAAETTDPAAFEADKVQQHFDAIVMSMASAI